MSQANQLHVQTESCLIFLWCIAYIQLEREMCLFLFLLIQQNFIILRLNICDGTAVFCSFARQRNFKWKIIKSTFLVVYVQHYYIDNQFNVSFAKNSLRHFYGKYLLMMKNVFVDLNKNGYFYAGWHSKNNKQKNSENRLFFWQNSKSCKFSFYLLLFLFTLSFKPCWRWVGIVITIKLPKRKAAF